MSPLATVTTLAETDLIRTTSSSTATLDDKQITLADLRNDILNSTNGLYLERTDPDMPLSVWIRNMASTIARYPEFNATNYAGNTQGYPIWTLYNIPGTHTLPQAPPGNFPLGSLIAHSHDGVDFAAAAAIDFRTGSYWTPTSHGGRVSFKTVKDGEISNPVERMALEDDGRLTFNPPITITGSRSDGTALTNLLAQLSARGLIVDNTTP